MTGYPAGVSSQYHARCLAIKVYIHIYENIRLPADGMISVPQETLQQNGKIVYRVTFIAPEGRELEINTTTKTVTLETNYLHKPYEPLMPVSRGQSLPKKKRKSEPGGYSLYWVHIAMLTEQEVCTRIESIVTLRLDESHILSPSKYFQSIDNGVSTTIGL